MMHMSFWWGSEIGDFLISGLKVNSALSMLVLCFCLFILSITVEAMKVHKARSRAKAAREKSRSLSCNPSESSTLISNEASSRRPCLQELTSSAGEISFFASHNIVSYALMLAVMGYNGYVFIAVVLGAFVGYFLFGHLSMKTNMENLQAIRTKIVCSVRCADSENPCSSPTVVGEGSGARANILRSTNSSSSIDSVSSNSDDSQTHVIKSKTSCH